MNHNQYIIRNAQHEDTESMLPLLADLGYPTTLNDFSCRLKAFLEMPGYGVVVCEFESKIIGFVAWSQSLLFVINAKRLHIEALVVHPDYRQQKVGQKLMQYVEAIAQECSPAIVDLTSSLWRQSEMGSHTFYEKLGYENKKQSCYFRKYV